MKPTTQPITPPITANTTASIARKIAVPTTSTTTNRRMASTLMAESVSARFEFQMTSIGSKETVGGKGPPIQWRRREQDRRVHDCVKNPVNRGARVRLQSRSKLGLRLMQATAAANDAEDRAARDRLDRRFARLDETPRSLSDECDQTVQDGEREPEYAHAGFSPNQPQDPDGDPQQSKADPPGPDPAGRHTDLTHPTTEEGEVHPEDAEHQDEDATAKFISHRANAQRDEDEAEDEPKDPDPRGSQFPLGHDRSVVGREHGGVSAEGPTK